MKDNDKRKVEIVVLSDVHLGTYGCHAKDLLRYLKSIEPQTLILNGDFIDIWQFSKKYWPKSHMKIVKYVMKMVSKGVRVHYITGNHDDVLRKFNGFELGSFSIENKLLLKLQNNKTAWIFHGDVFDITMQYSKWLAKLGAAGYDFLILLNRFVNFISLKIFRKGKISLSKKIKNSVKKAIKFINDFEETAAEIGIENGYDYVICGHIHQPQKRVVSTEKGSIIYLNSGDWIENLSALEYANGEWNIFYYEQMKEADEHEMPDEEELNTHTLFQHLIQEFNLTKRA